jgi:hypothetical protein
MEDSYEEIKAGSNLDFSILNEIKSELFTSRESDEQKSILPKDDSKPLDLDASVEAEKSLSSIKESSTKAEATEADIRPEAVSEELTDEIPTSDVVCVDIFHIILDTAQSFKIYKLLVNEERVQEISNILPEQLYLIGLYGITEVIVSFLQKYFSKEIPIYQWKEGIYLFYDLASGKGALAYITQDENIFTVRPIKTQSRLTNIIRILSDMCIKVVACISENLCENWYFEGSGTKNPFIPKIHEHSGIELVNVKVQESSLEKVELTAYNEDFDRTIFPKDSSKYIFKWSQEEISYDDQQQLKKEIKTLYESLSKLTADTIYKLNWHIHQFQNNIKSFKLDSEIFKTKLKIALERLINSKTETKRTMAQKLLKC